MYLILICKDFSPNWNLCFHKHWKNKRLKIITPGPSPSRNLVKKPLTGSCISLFSDLGADNNLLQCYMNFDTTAQWAQSRWQWICRSLFHSCITCACINHGRIGLFCGFSNRKQGYKAGECALKKPQTNPQKETNPEVTELSTRMNFSRKTHFKSEQQQLISVL